MWPEIDLFHYTSFDAFLGIIRNRTIWASSMSLLNDEKEYRYTVELLKPHMEKLLQKHQNKVLIEQVRRLIENSEGGPTYVTSFSENPDLLSQWRAYCRNGGCSIGFEKNGIREITERSGLNLVKCNYSLDEQKRMVTEFVDQLSSMISLKEDSIKDRNQALKFYGDYVYNQINMLANKIKHPAFEEEQEWRFVKTFVYANHPSLKYRAGKGMLIPYFEISLINSGKDSNQFPAISEIHIAPHNNSKMSEKTVRTFLVGERARRSDSPFVYVKRSDAPYREI